MSSWIETQYDPRPNPPYLYHADLHADHPDPGMPEPDHIHHTPSMQTVYSVTPHPSHNSSRQTYNSGLYGPRPLHPPVEPIYAPHTIVPPAMTELDDADDEDAETMELDPGIDQGPIYQSEFDDVPQPHNKRRFVGGFIRGLRKIPRAMKRGFRPDRRAHTPPSLAYHYQSPYHSPYATNILNAAARELSENPPYDAAEEHIEGDPRYSEVTNVLTPTDGPSRTMSQAIRAPRIESQPTYQSLTNPSSRHHSHHGSLHNAQRSSPPRTVRNPDPASSTEEGSDIRTNAHSPQPSRHPIDTEPSHPGTSPISPLDPTRRPTVTVQSPTRSPIYVEPELADDYAAMDTEVEPEPEPSVPSQFARIGKFFRELNNLPWVSPNVTVDFNPEDSGRGRHVSAHPRGTGKSWYTSHLHDLDLLGGAAGDSSTRRLTAPSGHSLAHAQGSSATLARGQGSGSASSSEGATTHLPAPHVGPGFGLSPSSLPSYTVPQIAMPSQPLYFFPATYPAMQPQPPQPRGPGPSPNGADQTSPQSSGNSDPGVPRQQPYFYVVAMPPAYVGGPVDPSRPTMPQPQYGGMPYSPPVPV